MAIVKHVITIRPDPGYLERRMTRDFVDGLVRALGTEGNATGLSVTRSVDRWGNPSLTGKVTITEKGV